MRFSISINRALAGAVAVACLAAAAIIAAPATADFSPPYDQQCSGIPIAAAGTSVGTPFWQNGAADFSAADAPEACPNLQPNDVDYTGSSSGEGLAAFRGVRDPNVRLVGTVEAPGPIETALMEAGDLEAAGDDAQLRTIPQYAASVAVIVNFPEGCTIPAENAIGEGSTQRFQVSNATLEAAFAGDASADTWGELLPGIGGEGCAAKPLKRVVREERSGATFALKRWLHTVNGKRGWQLLTNPLLNTGWPNEKVNLVRAADTSVSGNVDEAAAVKATDGSIGYAGLDAARAQGFSEAGINDDDNYWIPVRNTSGELAEPSQFRVTSILEGANCSAVTFTGVPSGADPTLESWGEVSAASTAAGYPLCALGYALAWDDASDAYGTAEDEQAKQRMVRDFLGYQLSEIGQLSAQRADTSELPSSILTVAQGGQRQVSWAKP